MNDDWSVITCILYQGGAAALVQFEGMHYRRDIGVKGLARKSS